MGSHILITAQKDVKWRLQREPPLNVNVEEIIKIFSSTPYSQTPSDYVPPLMSATKFHTHTKQQAKL